MRIQINTGSRVDKYPAKQHARNVAAKLGATSGLIYLIGQHARLLEDSDMDAEFRQRRYFFYLSGVPLPDCALTYSIAHDWLTLFIPEINPRDALWNGTQPTREDILSAYDIDCVFFSSVLPRHLDIYSQRYPTSTIYTIHNHDAPFPPNQGKLIFDRRNLQPTIDECRLIKDGHEIGLIKKANDVSTHGHTAIFLNACRFQNEREMAALFVYECMKNGSEVQAYHPITPAGENCALLHYNRNNEPTRGKQLALIDCGAEYNCYAADVTRTFPLNGRFTPEAKEIYELVLDMQETCIKRVKNGVAMYDLYILAHRIGLRGLIKLGIVKDLKGRSEEEILALGVSNFFFPHGLGHHLGLDCHDTMYPSTPPSKRSISVLSHDEFVNTFTKEKPLEPGMVITIEPGIYFNRNFVRFSAEANPEAMKCIDEKVLERYWAVGGVRIEDDILVTENGSINLTSAPKLVPEIETLVRRENGKEKVGCKCRLADCDLKISC